MTRREHSGSDRMSAVASVGIHLVAVVLAMIALASDLVPFGKLGFREFCVAACGPVVAKAGELQRLPDAFAFSALERVLQTTKNVVIIAEDVEGEALGTLILNRLKGVFNTVAVKAPSFGERRKEILDDIAILTGATVISEERGVTFDNAELSVIGTARKVIVGKDDTTIVEGAGTSADIAARVKQINAQIELQTANDTTRGASRSMGQRGAFVADNVAGGAEGETPLKSPVDADPAAARLPSESPRHPR